MKTNEKKIKIKFIDYDEPQKINKNLITSILLKKYNIVEDNNPDIVICSMLETIILMLKFQKFIAQMKHLLIIALAMIYQFLYICNEPNQFQTIIFSNNYEYIYDFLNNDLSKLKKYIDSPKIKFCAFMYQNKYA